MYGEMTIKQLRRKNKSYRRYAISKPRSQYRFVVKRRLISVVILTTVLSL